MNDEEKEVLTGNDYIHMPLGQLASHPNYSNHALRVISRVLDMTTEELEQLDVLPSRHPSLNIIKDKGN